MSDTLDQNYSLSVEEIKVNRETKENFLTAGKWCKFLAVMGFISVGLMGLLGLLSLVGSSMIRRGDTTQITIMGVVYIIMAGIFVFPALNLLRYSNFIKNALDNNSQSSFDDAVLNLKSLFKFIGIYTIVLVSIYILAAIVGVGVAASGARF